jgi:hypothetical protein
MFRCPSLLAQHHIEGSGLGFRFFPTYGTQKVWICLQNHCCAPVIAELLLLLDLQAPSDCVPHEFLLAVKLLAMGYSQNWPYIASALLDNY